jgi:hypothetical protein
MVVVSQDCMIVECLVKRIAVDLRLRDVGGAVLGYLVGISHHLLLIQIVEVIYLLRKLDPAFARKDVGLSDVFGLELVVLTQGVSMTQHGYLRPSAVVVGHGVLV